MWQHIDVQADWRKSWTYGWAPNAIDISYSELCEKENKPGTWGIKGENVSFLTSLYPAAKSFKYMFI